MGLRESVARLIEKKQQEIRDIELKLAESRAYLEALMAMSKLVLSDSDNGSGSDKEVSLRPNSGLAQARDAILAAGKPLYVDDLLRALGKDVTPKERVSLAGTLASYARKGKVFTKVGPNVFGLVELKIDSSEESSQPDLQANGVSLTTKD